jgi:predicted TIM-barrel fold metal-dependent hydrolase
MPIKDVVTLVNNNLNDRIFFGSDAPINNLFGNGLSTSDSIKQQIEEMRTMLSEKDFNAIMNRCPYNKSE